MTLLALIPARGGSKGIPKKNTKNLLGKPLIAWTIEKAKQAKCIDTVVVSTEDRETARLAKTLGAEVPFMRPAELATDETPGIAPVLHALEQLPEFEWVLLLQPTSPLRSVRDIEEIWDLCQERRAQAAVSVTEVTTLPTLMYWRDSNDLLKPVFPGQPKNSRRQDFPDTYSVNGALYLAKADWLKAQGTFISEETIGFVMPRERSVDLDTMEDWRWAEFLMRGESS